MPKKATKKKQPSRRSKIKHPALDPLYNTKLRRETIDADYLNQLSPEELDWYNKFMEEWNGASFKNDETDLHQSQEDKRDIYGRNNARNRCMYSIAKANNLFSSPESVKRSDIQRVQTKDELEDRLIEYIDSQKEELEPTKKFTDTVNSTGSNRKKS